MKLENKNNKLIEIIIDKVRNQKKYKTISKEIIVNEVNDYLKKYPKARDDKQTIKEIRAQLHRSYSSFQTKKKRKAEQYLEEYKNNSTKENLTKLLSITLSTKERLLYYPELYKKIFKITGKPKTIIDLGCGLNPLSYPLMNLSSLAYFAYDIDEEDIKFQNNYFEIMKSRGLNGKAAILGIRDTSSISFIPSSDIIFLFKIIDIIDKENHKPSEELIKQLINKTNFIVASFATKTITRKLMNNPKRKWFELMLDRLSLKYEIIEIPNEIFYVIST